MFVWDVTYIGTDAGRLYPAMTLDLFAHCEAVAGLFEYIEMFYNRSRRHSSLSVTSRTQFMQG